MLARRRSRGAGAVPYVFLRWPAGVRMHGSGGPKEERERERERGRERERKKEREREKERKRERERERDRPAHQFTIIAM